MLWPGSRGPVSFIPKTAGKIDKQGQLLLVRD